MDTWVNSKNQGLIRNFLAYSFHAVLVLTNSLVGEKWFLTNGTMMKLNGHLLR